MSPKFGREELSDGSFIDRAIDFIVPDQWRPHGTSYRFAWVRAGKCRVLFDNHHGKGDHFHVDGIESEYTFVSIEKAFEDFLLEIRKAGADMKVRKFKIVIVESQEEGLKDFKARLIDDWNAASARKPFKDDYDLVLTLIGISSLGKIFSPQRIRILQTIREQKPGSIYQLAKLLNRTENNVRKDVQDLAKYGIIELKKVRKKGQKRECLCPEYKWDGFDIAV